jgi:hypothetical protein
MLKNNSMPKARGVYAFTRQRRGDFILFLENDNGVLKFMQLPDCYSVNLTPEEFANGEKTKLLDFVEQIPEDVFAEAKLNVKP